MRQFVFFRDVVITHTILSVKGQLEEITWPFDFDAHVVFRSADFVKYFIILSVNF